MGEGDAPGGGEGGAEAAGALGREEDAYGGVGALGRTCADANEGGPGATPSAAGEAGREEEEEEGEGGGPSAADVAAMDALILRCVVHALRTTATDKRLPLAAGVFWMAHVLPARPVDAVIDIGRSSFRRPAKLLSALAAAGLWAIGEDKRTHELQLLKVNRAHAIYQDYNKAEAGQTVRLAETVAAEAEAAAAAAERTVVVAELFSALKREPRALLAAAGVEPDALLSAKQASDALWAYVKREGLDAASRDRAAVVLDPLLCDALCSGRPAGCPAPDHMSKAEARPVDCFVGDMHPEYPLVQAP